MNKQVFLGGSCNPTTWRMETAIPALEKAGIAFYNPQVADWHSELVALESAAKDESSILLFVIDSQTRAIASILEATEYTVAGRDIYLVIDDMTDNTEVEGQIVTGRELKDLNRARTYLRDLAKRHDKAMIFENVEDAMTAITANI
jgi:hypothetical protein